MTDITKLLDEHPLPWTPWHPWMDRPDVVMDASGQCVRLTPSIVLALANALHAERQKRNPVIRTAEERDQIAEMRRNIVSLANRIGRAFELIGDLERIVRDGERLEAIEKRLDAIANAARGSDE